MTTTTELRELSAQITAALEHLPPEATAAVRVRHGAGPVLAAGELWVTSGPGQVPAWTCELPAAVGLRMNLVERALDEAGLAYRKADLDLRARWRRVMASTKVVAGYELAIQISGARAEGIPTSRLHRPGKT
ncbi:hypothetical protein APR04_001686 [Promicromonospora umidemergens]|nr:hypothetical protein [Promicromonospora umidemergens]MCP2282783.1 hypothetical protein [Promicromonospora umidemergens]